jgi:hypothetical protein
MPRFTFANVLQLLGTLLLAAAVVAACLRIPVSFRF